MRVRGLPSVGASAMLQSQIFRRPSADVVLSVYRHTPAMNHASPLRSPQLAAPARLPWETPRVTALPRLTELTLATGGGIPGGGGTGGGGSTVIP